MIISGILNVSDASGGQVSPGAPVIPGLCVAGGMAGAWFFQKIRFLQVVGYIFIGLLLGDAGFGLIHTSDVENLGMVNLSALGVTGFLVGGEFRLDVSRRYAREFLMILSGEGMAAFLLIGSLCFLIVYLAGGGVPTSLAAAAVFGAIAAATDPASAIDMIWVYRAKGAMTVAIIAIVALALTLYGVGTSSARLLTGNAGSVWKALMVMGTELFGAIAPGAACAFALIRFLRYQREGDRAAALSAGAIMLVIGVASFYHFDVILAAMMLGFILTDFAPRRSEEIFRLMRSFSIPIYVLFFVFVGARLSIWEMPKWLWLAALAYVVGRSFGKWAGAWPGARAVGSSDNIRRYLGLGIFAQGGVAIGLSVVAAEKLKPVMITEQLSLGDMIVYMATAATLVLQLLGPAMVKLSLKLAGEAGRDITREDVMKLMEVRRVMIAARAALPEQMPLAEVFKVFRNRDSRVYPVVDGGGLVAGF